MSMAERRRMLLATLGGFPSQEPTAYERIGTYTTSQTWTAPESGYFQIEVFGASGSGGQYYSSTNMMWCGGGGGGGGYACSRIKLKKGDKIILSPGSVGATSYAEIDSSMETYLKMSVTSGATGGNGSFGTGGAGGAGGIASGGNYINANGGTGGAGANGGANRGTGGTAGYSGGNAGGKGAGALANEAGKAGFIKIYRGNTN